MWVNKRWIMNKELIDNFIKEYKPGNNLTKPDEKILEFGKQMLPPEILYLWENYGFGNLYQGRKPLLRGNQNTH